MDMECDGQNFEKKSKTLGDIIIVNKCTKNMLYCYPVPEIWHVTDVIVIFPFGLFFSLLSPPSNSPKNVIFFKKMKKAPGDIIILHKCTKNHDHRLHCSWDMAHNGCNFFHFGLFFAHLPPKKSKFQKNEKNSWRYHHFTHVYPKIMIRWCTVPEIWCMTDRWTDRKSDI